MEAEIIQEAKKPDTSVADFNLLQCQYCKKILRSTRALYQHKRVMHSPYVYVCNIKSADNNGKETECINRTLYNFNFRVHLKDKHGILVTDMKELEKWKQIKKGASESNDSQSYCQCHDCRRSRKSRKNAAKNPRNRWKPKNKI